jgi:uncharacterized membrane protein YsdA (DUF1294 family)
MIAIAVAYVFIINAAAFLVFASDKRRAVQGARRIPEHTLLELALIGGTVGSLTAQRVLRHKTRKEPFRTQLWLIAAGQIVGLVAAAVWLATGGAAEFNRWI